MEPHEEEQPPQPQRLTVPIHIDTNVSEDSASPPFLSSSSTIPLPPRSPTTAANSDATIPPPFHFEVTPHVEFSKPSTPETTSQRLADRHHHHSASQRPLSQDSSSKNHSPESGATTDSSGPNSPEFISPALVRMHQEQMMKKQMQLQQLETPSQSSQSVADFRTRMVRAATLGSPPQSLSRIRSPITHTTTRIDVHSPTPALAAASLTPSLTSSSSQLSLLERRPSQLRVNSPGTMTMRLPSSTSRAASSLHRRTPSISFFHISTPSAALASSSSSSSSSAVNSAVASASSATARKSMLMRRSSMGLLARQSSSPSTLTPAAESAAAAAAAAAGSQHQAPSSATAAGGVAHPQQQQVAATIPPPQFDAEDLAHFNPAFSQPTQQHHQRLMSFMASSDFVSSLSSLSGFGEAPFAEAPDSTTSTSLNNTTLDVVLHGAEIDLGAEQLDRMAWRLFESEEKARILRTERIFLFLWTIALLLNVDAGYILALLMNFYADSTPSTMMPPPSMPISSGFHSFTNLALLHTLNSFGLFVGGICSGPLLERVQQNKLLAAVLTLEALFLLLVGVSSNSGVVLFCRFLSGVCSAPLFVYIPAWILVHAPSLNLQENWTGMFHATTPVGIKLGFAIGIAAALQQTSSSSYSAHALFDPSSMGFNTDHAWKWTFLIQAIVLFPLALAFLFLPRSLISTTISDRKPVASHASTTASNKPRNKYSSASSSNSLNNTGNTGSTSFIMQELVRARVTAMQELHERLLHPATAAFFSSTAVDEFGDPVVGETMHHPTLSHQPREERSPSMNLKKLTLNVVGSPTVGNNTFFPAASPSRATTVSTTSASHSHTAQTPSVPSSQRVSSFQPIVTNLPAASAAASSSAATTAVVGSTALPTPAASISRSGRRFSRSDASPLAPLRNKTNSFPNLQALASTRSDHSIHTPIFDANASSNVGVPPTPAIAVEGVEVGGSPIANMMSPMSTTSAAMLSQQLQSLVAASAVEDLSSPMSIHSADANGVESQHLSLYSFFDSMDLSAFFAPRYRMVSWSWNPAGSSKTQSQQQLSTIVQPSHSYWNLTGSQSEEDERNRKVSVVEMLSMLSDQFSLLLSNYLYVAMCFSICTLLFFISAFYFWLTPYMLYAYPSLHLSVVGLASILIFPFSTNIGVWSGHLLMHRIEAALDQKYDLEMQQHSVLSSAKEKQKQKLMLQQGIAESDRSGPLFDTVGRKSRQLTKHIFVAIMILSGAFFIFAALLASAAPPSQSPVFAFILIFFLLLFTSALLPMMHWIMEAAIASHTESTDLVGFALALSQIIYHLFGYAFAPLFIGVIIDASSGGHDLTWAFQFCLYWSVPFVLSIAISAVFQWKECDHQRTLEDIQRSVFLTMGGHLDAADGSAEDEGDKARLPNSHAGASSSLPPTEGGDQSTLSYAHEHLRWQQHHSSRLNVHDRKESGRQNSVAGVVGVGGLLVPTHAHHHSSAPSLRSSPALPFTATPSPAPVHSRHASSTSNALHSIHDSLPIIRQMSPPPLMQPPPTWSRSGSMIATEVQGFATDYDDDRGVTPPRPYSYSGGESMSFAAEDLAVLRRDSTGSGDGMQLSPAYHPHPHHLPHHDFHHHASDVPHSPHASSVGDDELEVEALDDDEENFVLYGRAMQDD